MRLSHHSYFSNKNNIPVMSRTCSSFTPMNILLYLKNKYWLFIFVLFYSIFWYKSWRSPNFQKSLLVWFLQNISLYKQPHITNTNNTYIQTKLLESCKFISKLRKFFLFPTKFNFRTLRSLIILVFLIVLNS